MERIDDNLSFAPPTEIPQTMTKEEMITWDIMKENDMRARNYTLALMSNDLQHYLEHFMSVASI